MKQEKKPGIENASEKTTDEIIKRGRDRTLKAAKRLLDIFLDNDGGLLEFKIGVNPFVLSLSDKEIEFWSSLHSLCLWGFEELNQCVDGELLRYALKKIIGTETIKPGERAHEEILGLFATQFNYVTTHALSLKGSAESFARTAAKLRREFSVDSPDNLRKVDVINTCSEDDGTKSCDDSRYNQSLNSGGGTPT